MSRLVVGSATDVGLVRSNNQDQLLVAPGLYAVADGMGGHAAGEVASATAVRALQAAFDASDQRSTESLQSAAKAANRAVWEQARANKGMLGMGTTLVALAVVERDDGTSGLAIAHIGDSRVYVFRDGSLSQITVDHSLVQELVDEGSISPEQAAVHPQRHVLTRALGVEPAVKIDLIQVTPLHGDRYVLCSDGLPREVSDEQIAAVLQRFSDPDDAAKELVALANSRGGSDNITVVVVDVLANDDHNDLLAVTPGPAPGPLLSRAIDGDDGPTSEIAPPGRPPGNYGPARSAVALVTSAAPGLGPSARGSLDEAGALGPPPKGAGVHRFTWRVFAFIAALFLVLGAAIGCLAWYARSAYFVTLSAGKITIFQGRPGGVLWFGPTLATRTSLTESSVEAHWLSVLEAGQPEPSLAQAQQFINTMLSEKREAEAVTPSSAKGPPRHHLAPTSTTATSTRPVEPTTARAREQGKERKARLPGTGTQRAPS